MENKSTEESTEALKTIKTINAEVAIEGLVMLKELVQAGVHHSKKPMLGTIDQAIECIRTQDRLIDTVYRYCVRRDHNELYPLKVIIEEYRKL